ncbi:hypothetical protein O53_2561 [Microcystis aeruginosa TAIHU98]|uniref:Uncharacterized protein n=1 Tax=Microcystis aeruginosa TAIHU98 TaxID=1134457 RepID=L7E3Y8_MICAE|nr:hypothetical protein O53_2561 [Microcystis aeruginosa TAIHU98]
MNGNSSSFRSICSSRQTLYSLEKLIEWKLGWNFNRFFRRFPLYSLEKLIEWKLNLNHCFTPKLFSLYSLEKLIEWKLDRLIFRRLGVALSTR